MRTCFLLVTLVLATTAHAERPLQEGKKLAKEAVRQIYDLQPFILEGNGLSGTQQTIYYRKFQNPLQASIKQWPEFGAKENSTWGDYLYCRDALNSLLIIGMGQHSGTNGKYEQKRIDVFKKERGQCEEASRN